MNALPRPGRVTCDNCGAEHVAEYSHESLHGQGPIFAVVCTEDELTDYYTELRVTR